MGRLSVLGYSQKRLQVLFDEGTFSGLTDGAILDRLSTPGDRSAAAAFAALVERHGPMVLRVCQQVLADPHDAEDAFQATFLVFFRRAGSIHNRGSLASWLFGVAHRVACRARKQTLRRQGHERRYAEQVAEESRGFENRSETWPEVLEEVALLPDKLRSPIILCYLKGLTAEAAALELGCPRGTVLSRLSSARERLRNSPLSPWTGVARRSAHGWVSLLGHRGRCPRRTRRFPGSLCALDRCGQCNGCRCLASRRNSDTWSAEHDVSCQN